jgi:hypothetical protein
MDHHLPQSCFGGQNVAVEYRWAGDRVAWSTPTAQAAKQATKSIPIIAAVMADPVGDLRARRIMLTHMNPVMLAHLDEVRAAGALVAEDGAVIDL